jgi:hypothetical protein
LRSQTIERVFADAKEKHFMRYTQLRGKAKLKMQVLLTFACMNLKKLASWKKKTGLLSPILGYIFEKSLKLSENSTRYWKFVFPIPRLSTV